MKITEYRKKQLGLKMTDNLTDEISEVCYKVIKKLYVKTSIPRIISYCQYLCKNLGFDFYKCMLEKIKEIESRTGFYDERLNKFIKDTSDEAKAKWYKADYESCRL
ncbi:TPA_asm: hypothetical protein GD700_07550 [Campylobacter jejuni]|nr:hypothetical protein [Campylobacter jejuni]